MKKITLPIFIYEKKPRNKKQTKNHNIAQNLYWYA
jgi:hypothetical protein